MEVLTVLGKQELSRNLCPLWSCLLGKVVAGGSCFHPAPLHAAQDKAPALLCPFYIGPTAYSGSPESADR